MAAAYTVTVTVRRPTFDRRGNTTSTTTHQVAGCIVAPASGDSGQSASRERTEGLTDTVITGWTLYPPYGADIRATDEVQLPGDPTWWQVQGDIGNWASPFTNWRPGGQVALRRVRG